MTPKPGIYHHIPMADYLAWDAVSSGALDDFDRSPAHMRAATQEETDALALGTAIHCAVFEPEIFPALYIPKPEPDGEIFRNKDGSPSKNPGATAGYKKMIEELEAANPGAVFLTPEESRICNGIAASLYGEPPLSKFAARIFLEGDGDNELSLVWRDPATGLSCKARPDRIAHNYPGLGRVMGDLKSTTDAREDAFTRDAWKLGYFRKAAFYMRGARVLGMDVAAFVFIAAEKQPPYDFQMHNVVQAVLEEWDQRIDKTLAAWKSCAEQSKWTGYPDRVSDLTMSTWQWDRMEANYG